jgi:hypothetical protein
MGSMSASDAAPLPRLGEVYFDVRGESRSMRLSWYVQHLAGWHLHRDIPAADRRPAPDGRRAAARPAR